MAEPGLVTAVHQTGSRNYILGCSIVKTSELVREYCLEKNMRGKTEAASGKSKLTAILRGGTLSGWSRPKAMRRLVSGRSGENLTLGSQLASRLSE